MPAIRADAVLRNLAQGRLGGVYFLHGDEELLKERLAAQIVDAHLDPATRDFNLDQLRAGDVEAETLGSVLATPPMLAEWRVVVVRDVQALAGAARSRGTIEQLLKRPVPGLAVILLASIPDGSKAAFYDTLKKQAVAVELNSLSENDLPGWLLEEAEARGFQLAPAAARAMASAVGGDLGFLARELDKLRDYVGDRRSAGPEDVAVVVGTVPRQDRWDWFDMVAEGRFAEARQGASVLLEGSESGVGLVLGLGTHFLRLAVAVHGGERALESELPQRQRWLAGKTARQARRWTVPAVDAALADLLRADRLLKSASLGDERVVDELLLRLEARTTGR